MKFFFLSVSVLFAANSLSGCKSTDQQRTDSILAANSSSSSSDIPKEGFIVFQGKASGIQELGLSLNLPSHSRLPGCFQLDLERITVPKFKNVDVQATISDNQFRAEAQTSSQGICRYAWDSSRSAASIQLKTSDDFSVTIGLKHQTIEKKVDINIVRCRRTDTNQSFMSCSINGGPFSNNTSIPVNFDKILTTGLILNADIEIVK
ncbi:MAG: hypothetical protein NT027_13470 [Proteobacteria bacterium]|nr:hypothetical protein [Pseudomonadota bacterium]